MPILLFGIDLSFMAKQMQEMVEAMKAGKHVPDIDSAEANKHLRRRP